MNTSFRALSLALLAAAAFACASHQGPPPPPPVQVPPQIDLKEHEIIGVIEFKSSGRAALGPLATRKFTDVARRDQGLVKMVPLGTEAEVLRSIGRDKLDPAAMIEIGRQRNVKTILVGTIDAANLKPAVRVATDLKAAGLTSQVKVTLDAQLIDAATGASMWNSSTNSTGTLGHVDVAGGHGVWFDADDPERAYGALIDDAIGRATRPFRVTWEQR